MRLIKTLSVVLVTLTLFVIHPLTVNGHGKFPINTDAWVSITYDPASAPTGGRIAQIVEDATGIIARGAGNGFTGIPLFTNTDESATSTYQFCWEHVLSQGFRNGGTRYAWNGEWWFADNNYSCNQTQHGENVWLSISLVDNGTYRYHGYSHYHDSET